MRVRPREQRPGHPPVVVHLVGGERGGVHTALAVPELPDLELPAVDIRPTEEDVADDLHPLLPEHHPAALVRHLRHIEADRGQIGASTEGRASFTWRTSGSPR